MFDIIVPDDGGYHQSPHDHAADIGSGRAQEAGKSNQGAADRAEENGANKGGPVGIMLTHGLHHHIAQHHHALFHQNLSAVGMCLQAFAQIHTGPAQQDRHQQKGYRSLRDGNTAENGNLKVDKRTGYLQFHFLSLLSS